MLLVEAAPPQQALFTFGEWQIGATTDAQTESDTEGERQRERADLRHWILGGASWIVLDNSSEDKVRQSTDYLRAILQQRQPKAPPPTPLPTGTEKPTAPAPPFHLFDSLSDSLSDSLAF